MQMAILAKDQEIFYYNQMILQLQGELEAAKKVQSIPVQTSTSDQDELRAQVDGLTSTLRDEQMKTK
jgi:hypothetical protein